jgi:hypothetical protein
VTDTECLCSVAILGRLLACCHSSKLEKRKDRRSNQVQEDAGIGTAIVVKSARKEVREVEPTRSQNKGTLALKRMR